MSVNPPADGGYQYYHKNLEELEAELQNQQKRSRERFEAREADLEAGYERNTRRREEDMNRTVQNVKENMNATLEQEREYNKAEVDRIKAQTYDKWGRYNGLEADTLKQELATTVGAYEQDKKNARTQADEAQKAYEARISQMNREHREALESQAREARDSADALFTKKYGDEKRAYDADHKASKEQYEMLNQQRMEDLNFQRRAYETALTEARANYDHRTRKAGEKEEDRFAKQQRAYDDRAEQSIRNTNDSHARETRIYRDQIKEMTSAQGDYNKGRAEGQRDAVKQYEDEWRDTVSRNSEAFGQEINNLKYKSKQESDYFNHLHNQSLREKDAYFAKLIANQNLENHQSQQQTRTVFEKDRDQLLLRNQRDRELATSTMESQLREANAQRDKALENQARAYQQTIANTRESDDVRIKQLERQLHNSSTSEDPNVISPAAENSVRKSVIREYEKTFGEERNRNAKTVDSIQKEYSNRLNDTIYESKSRENEIQTTNQSERHRERQDLLQHIQDTEFVKAQTLRNKELDHQRETENVNRSYARMIDRQRKQYEEILGASKGESTNRLQDQRQALEFQQKMAQREFAARQNQTVREYEKRLNDQKADFDAQMAEVKAAAERQVREGERKSKQELAEMTRMYEQRLAQSDYQHKERERYLTQNYQDELDKARRSSASLRRKT